MSDDEEKLIAAISDYLDGALAPAERDEVAKKIEADPAWKRVHDDLVELRKDVSGLQKARPSPSFAQDVTATIAKRSDGRFFARKTLGDRVPFGVLLVVAVVLLGGIGYVMWSSQTGSLKVERDHGSGSAGSGLGIAP